MASKMDDACLWIVERHKHWCDYLQRWVESQVPVYNGRPIEIPALEIRATASKSAGMYRSATHTCRVSLPYHLLYPQHTDETIAHEVVHSYQRRALPGCQWHGDMFLFMLRQVCGFRNAKTKHSMNVHRAKKVGELLRLELGRPIVTCWSPHMFPEKYAAYGWKEPKGDA